MFTINRLPVTSTEYETSNIYKKNKRAYTELCTNDDIGYYVAIKPSHVNG